MRQSRFVPVAGWLSLVVLVVLAGSPTLGQAPKYGGGLTLRLRADLPQGFEDPVLGRADESSLCQNYRPATVAIGQNR